MKEGSRKTHVFCSSKFLVSFVGFAVVVFEWCLCLSSVAGPLCFPSGNTCLEAWSIPILAAIVDIDVGLFDRLFAGLLILLNFGMQASKPVEEPSGF